ncbi:hypothetical protein BDV59DRAFT_210632 [Aspergillus ambiguus]|uniref:Zn(II)2Cys6 transcription factor n=1 Tax=Aspergillus ambiguus TaxID=176160 RepID=UPI003CCD32E2
MERSNPQRTRPPQACEVCHEKKIRCDLAEGPPCSNCQIYNATCRPHQRKRKRPARPSSPTADVYLRGKRHNNGPQISWRCSLPNPIQPAPNSISPPHSVPIPAVKAISDQRQGATPPTTSEETDHVAENTPESRGYLGRSEYLGVTTSQTNEGTTDSQPEKTSLLSHEERVTLEVYRAFDLPPPSVQRSLIESFRKYCAPWMPIVEDSWLQDSGGNPPSFLLLQSVFLAGSRVAAAPYISTTSEQYYRRAKSLFFSSYEKNPIIKIAAACLLNWWNPRGPEEVSLDGSGFWLRVAVSLAYQIGLHREPPRGKTARYRRRLWWSLVARDCQLSAAHGRPSAITLADSDVAPPSILDFGREDPNAELFVAFVKIDTILADVTRTYLRHKLSPAKRQEIRNALYCWTTELPASLRLFSQRKLNPYDLRTRSLHVAYFVTLIIVYRSALPSDVSTSVAVAAASFICGICEELLMRDELRFLGPIFKFYIFAPGMVLVNARAHLLETEITPSIDIIRASLSALSERWPSANRNIDVLDGILRSSLPQPQLPRLPPIPDHHDAKALFGTFGPELCSMWNLLDYNADISDPRVSTSNGGGTTSLFQPAGEPLAPMDALAAATFMDQINSHSMDPSTLWTWPDMQAGDWLIDPEQIGLFGG